MIGRSTPEFMEILNAYARLAPRKLCIGRESETVDLIVCRSLLRRNRWAALVSGLPLPVPTQLGISLRMPRAAINDNPCGVRSSAASGQSH